MTTLTVSKTFSAPSAGTPAVTINKGSTNKAPLLAEFIVDISGCSFDSSDDYDGLFDVDYTGKIYDPSFHRLLYFWDLDDSVAEWSAPQNIPAEYANRSKAFGKKIMHVYTTAQAVNWKLEIWEPSSGKKAYASGTFTVDDPIATADHIVLVNPNGDTDFTEIDRTAYARATFYEEELAPGNPFGGGTEFSSYQSLDNVCWLFKAGGTYYPGILHDSSGAYPYFGQYGTTSTAKPVFDQAAGTAFTVDKTAATVPDEIRIQNISFQGAWTDYATLPIDKSRRVTCIRPKEGWKTILADCEFKAIYGQIVRSDATALGFDELHIAMANCDLEGLAGAEYAILIGNSGNTPTSNFCFVGNRYVDFDTLVSGPNQGVSNTNHRAFIRNNTPTGVHIRGNDFFRLAGGHGQPVLKLNKSHRSGGYGIVQFNSGEHSESLVNFCEDDSRETTAVWNAIVECNVSMLLPEGTRVSFASSTGTTSRSNYTVCGTWTDKNLSQSDSTYRARFPHHLVSHGGTYPIGEDAPSEEYNNHGVNLRTQRQNAGRGWGYLADLYDVNGTFDMGGAAQIRRRFNNFVHAPYQTDADREATYAPLKDDPAVAGDAITRPDGTEMRFRFIGWNPAGTPDTTYSYNGDYVPSGLFEIGSSAFKASDKTLSWPIDYLGRICGPNRALGAAERPDYALSLGVRTG
jgi:hypothetical protein